MNRVDVQESIGMSRFSPETSKCQRIGFENDFDRKGKADRWGYKI